jgi:hypothetical protein
VLSVLLRYIDSDCPFGIFKLVLHLINGNCFIFQLIMNNYASVGVDALVTLNFHKQRESRPWLFTHRLINKVNTKRESPMFIYTQTH